MQHMRTLANSSNSSISRGLAWTQLTSKSCLEGLYFDCRPSCFCKLPWCCRVSIVLSCLQLTYIQFDTFGEWIVECTLWEAFVGFSTLLRGSRWGQGKFHTYMEAEMVNVIQHLQLLTGMHLTKSDSHSAQNSTVSKVFGRGSFESFNHIWKDWTGYIGYTLPIQIRMDDDRVWMCDDVRYIIICSMFFDVFRCFPVSTSWKLQWQSEVWRALTTHRNYQHGHQGYPRLTTWALETGQPPHATTANLTFLARLLDVVCFGWRL